MLAMTRCFFLHPIAIVWDLYTRTVAHEERQLWMDAVMESLLAKRAFSKSVLVKVRRPSCVPRWE